MIDGLSILARKIKEKKKRERERHTHTYKRTLPDTITKEQEKTRSVKGGRLLSCFFLCIRHKQHK